MPSRSERDMEFMFNAFQNLGEALKKQREEAMTKELLRKIDPTYAGEPVSAYKLRRSVEDDTLNRRLKEAQITKALREPTGTANNRVMTDYGLVTPHQKYLMDRDKQGDNTFSKLDKEIEAATGVDLGTWRRAEKKRIDPVTGNFQGDIPVMHGGVPLTTFDVQGNEVPQTRTVSVPPNVYHHFLNKVRTLENLGATNTASTDQARPQVNPLPEPDLPSLNEPDNTTPSPSKQLDAATAKAILAEAGGDKNRARELAKQRGYSF